MSKRRFMSTEGIVCVVGITLVAALVAPAVAFAVDQPQPGTRTIYLIRHGEYDHDDPRDAGVGKALLPLGVAQARLVGNRLRALPVEMSSLHSSTLTRARQTALVIGEEFPGLGLEISDLLSECNPPIDGAPDSRSDLDSADRDAYFRPSDDGDRHDIVVCHGNMIRYLVTKVLGVDSKRWYAMSIANCSLTVVTIAPGGAMALLSFSDTGHLPENLTTRTFPKVHRDLKNPPATVRLLPAAETRGD